MICKIKASKDINTELKKVTNYIRKIDEIEQIDLYILAERVKYRARELAPKGATGKLERGIYASVSRSKSIPGINVGAVAMHKNYNYANIQHENMEFQHPNGGEAKFLLKALRELIPEFLITAERKLSRLD